jgi:hypothetical protein
VVQSDMVQTMLTATSKPHAFLHMREMNLLDVLPRSGLMEDDWLARPEREVVELSSPAVAGDATYQRSPGQSRSSGLITGECRISLA